MSHFMSAPCCALLLIDWQERLFPAMPERIRERNLKSAGHLRWLAYALDIPVLFSEQYPRGLGSTLEALSPTNAIDKSAFSAMKSERFSDAVRDTKRTTMILSGMETHICVAQTARDLRQAGFEVVLATDAVLSRRKLDWKMALQCMASDGCRLSTTEAVLFDWLEEAGTPLFKELSKRIR